MGVQITLWKGAILRDERGVLDGDPAVSRYVAMATNFWTQFAITGFVS